mgnify:FL=1
MIPLTEEQVREIARAEWRRLEEERQEACSHARSATLRDSVLVCDQCFKTLEWEKLTYSDELTTLEQRHVGRRA